MNCHELHQDIERLKAQRDALQEKVNTAAESGQGKKEVSSVQNTASAINDELIVKYYHDIKEQNAKDSEHRNAEFLNSLLPETESPLSPDVTIDQVRDNLEQYLKDDLRLESNLLTYALKEKLADAQDQDDIIEALKDIYAPILPNKMEHRNLYFSIIAERIKNLETYETENYIFMLPKDKWEEGKIALPENAEATYIVPNDLTAILKTPVDYDCNYETDGRITDDLYIVYDERWIGKEIRHFPWSKELFQAESAIMKPNGYHIPKSWLPITKALEQQYHLTSEEELSEILRSKLNLAFSGCVWEGDLDYVGYYGYFWSASEESARYAYCLRFNADGVGPEGSYVTRSVARSVRCVSESGSFPNS